MLSLAYNTSSRSVQFLGVRSFYPIPPPTVPPPAFLLPEDSFAVLRILGCPNGMPPSLLYNWASRVASSSWSMTRSVWAVFCCDVPCLGPIAASRLTAVKGMPVLSSWELVSLRVGPHGGLWRIKIPVFYCLLHCGNALIGITISMNWKFKIVSWLMNPTRWKAGFKIHILYRDLNIISYQLYVFAPILQVPENSFKVITECIASIQCL